MSSLACAGAPASSSSVASTEGEGIAPPSRAPARAAITTAEEARCTSYAEPEVLGRVMAPGLAEISGVAASVAHPGVLYVHNDSGEPYARFFAIRSDGTVLAEYALGELPARDLEDIALAPSPSGPSQLYLGDIGDNDARAGRPPRASIFVLRVGEPDPTRVRAADGEVPRVVLEDAQRFELRYPSEPLDCEALFVDPASGDLYLLGKVEHGPAPIFVARAPLTPDAPTVLSLVGTTVAAANLGDSITAASLDATGLRLVVRTYRQALLFDRQPAEPWTDALARAPVVLPRLHEPQGEAIGWLDANGTLVSISEGEGAPVQALRPTCTR